MAAKILIDADACPVKDECYKVAARHGLKVFVVANRLLQAPRHPMIERVLVPQGPDAADDWIAERAEPGTVVVTADIPLAARCVKAGAFVLAPNGKIFDDASIGMALAMRDLMEDLRATGAVSGGPKGFSPRDRSTFLSALERGVQQARRSPT
ncbi:YaiI/YqxD family protein [Rhodoblastus acidophilus]|uniref:UPF0178 protein GJ654_13925 n=1 Tax=Rhodoblastus acidophilus TaxID=1074 RepID=A0A6N8DTC1_RHOAC|nr:YaiI/YqxD family protein [Rhodoblastus acidophilus]MCW2275587.1 uncharacterized protein YaiI (UPF0178 family) [Rhodoblastus acidophilus]MTV32084.1 YaiI/YqxD family protein [Rhodoblastus acidophilus]